MSTIDKITLTTASTSDEIKNQFNLVNSLVEEESLKDVQVKKTISEEELRKYTEEFSPYPFFLYAYINRASDISLTPYPFANGKYNDNTRVSFRIDGVWSDEFQFNRELHYQYVNAIKNWGIKWSGNAKTENQKIPQDWKWILYILDQNKEIEKLIQLRLAFAPQHITNSKNVPLEKVVIRLLDNEWNPPLEKAWFNLFDFAKLKKLETLKKWLILISWPTWSWKSSTLFWYIDKINDRTRNIYTLENPVEFDVPWISQIDVLPVEDISDSDDQTLNFWRAEEFLMRAAPDVILVWEIRSYKTAKTASSLAWTWHISIWTIHTNTAIQTLDRLFGFKSKDWDSLDKISLIDSLEYVSAQMLSPKLCDHCKIKVKDLPNYLNTWDIVIDQLNRELLTSIEVQTSLVKKNLQRKNIVKILWDRTKDEQIQEWINESYVENYCGCEKCTMRKIDSSWKLMPPGWRVWRKWRVMLNEALWFDNYLKNLLLSEKYSSTQILEILLDQRPMLPKEDSNSLKTHDQYFTTLYQDALMKAILPLGLLQKIVPWATTANTISILDAKRYWYKEI